MNIPATATVSGPLGAVTWTRDILAPLERPPANPLDERGRKCMAAFLCHQSAGGALLEINFSMELFGQITREDWRRLYDVGDRDMQDAGLASIRALAAQFKAEDAAQAALDEIKNALETCHG